MFTKEMVDKIDKFLHDNIDIIFNFKFNGLILFWGGAIKSIIMDTPVNDLDFILLTQEQGNILDFINKYNLEYNGPFYNTYVINYNNYLIDFSVKNDLLGNRYNTDLIFYDIHRKQFIPFSIKQSIKKRKVVIYGYNGYSTEKESKHLRDTLKTARKFIQFMNNDNKRVRVIRKNKYYRRMLIGFLKHPSKIKKIFRRD